VEKLELVLDLGLSPTADLAADPLATEAEAKGN